MEAQPTRNALSTLHCRMPFPDTSPKLDPLPPTLQIRHSPDTKTPFPATTGVESTASESLSFLPAGHPSSPSPLVVSRPLHIFH